MPMTDPVAKPPSRIIDLPTGDLVPYGRNARRHSDKQIDLIARSIRAFGFVNPILIDRDRNIIAGHGRYEAAKRLGRATVPTILIDHLDPAQIRAYRIADNRIAGLSDWDEAVLRLEIADLVELEFNGALDFEVSLTGFDTPQIDLLLDPGAGKGSAAPAETVELPEQDAVAVTRPGDLWLLGAHRLLCGDALSAEDHAMLLGDDRVAMVFTDPPYNVPIRGHVRTGGATAHREFAMAVGEMDDAGFRSFLARSLGASLVGLVPGGILMVCMDWRHIEDLIAVGRGLGLGLLNLCVWNKSNGGMGSLYRSKHELVALFKHGTAPHVNNVELGKHGRYRTNVWDYAGVNTFRRGRAEDLVDHPTVKPTALVADAIRDVSHRGDVVLDPFGGSGTTLLAAEKTGRRARLIELDPLYVDVIIRRWQDLTGKEARLAATGESFAERKRRAAEAPPPQVVGVAEVPQMGEDAGAVLSGDQPSPVVPDETRVADAGVADAGAAMQFVFRKRVKPLPSNREARHDPV